MILQKGGFFTMDLTAISTQFEKYENKWVAIDESQERIVGVGTDAFEATEDAERHGYQDYNSIQGAILRLCLDPTGMRLSHRVDRQSSYI
jgi:hypothetical protein